MVKVQRSRDFPIESAHGVYEYRILGRVWCFVVRVIGRWRRVFVRLFWGLEVYMVSRHNTCFDEF